MSAFSHVADSIRDANTRELAGDVVACFRKHQLLIAAGGIAFRILLATVTGALCLLGLLGFFDLSEVYRSDVAPDLRASVSEASFRVIDQAVTHVLSDKALYWVTIGAAIALWQISAVVRASGQTLNRVYGVEDDRPLKRELASSLVAAVEIALVLVAALATVRLSPLGIDSLLGDSTVVAIASFVVRWTLAAALLLIAVAIVARTGPAIDRPARWVSFGSGLTVAGWIVISILFGLYLTQFASYATVYGALLSTFLLVEFLYLAAIVFLGGLVIDRLVEEGLPTSGAESVSGAVVDSASAPVAQGESDSLPPSPDSSAG